MLELHQLSAGYGKKKILHEISLKVEPGQIVALIGANGAGKTTTLLTIAGLLQPQAGSILFQGEKINDLSCAQILQRGLCLCPEGRRIFPQLTVLENLRSGAFLKSSLPEKQRLDPIFELFPILKERLTQLGGTLSGGEQQMLAIGRSLMSEAKCILFDEPSLGLAPIVFSKIFETFKQINQRGISILLVEQNAEQALQIAHRGYVMVQGTIVLEDNASNLLQSDLVRKAYLGEL